jgi:hypothetical protein
MSATPLSEVTRYLDLPRWHDRRGHPSLDTDEILELRRAAAPILAMPFHGGDRALLLQQLAERFGISVRTVYRYLVGDVVVVEVAGWVALYRVHGGGPRQMTAWSRRR